MKFLLSLLGFFAIAQVALAQTFSFPLTSLTVSAIDTQTNSGINSVNGNNQLNPSFSAYHNDLLRYAVEYSSSDPLQLSIQWSGPSTVTVRNCGSTLQVATTAKNSQCYYVSATTFSSGQAATVTVLPGTSYIELSTTGTINGSPYVFLYVITVGIYQATGSNMLSLETEDVYSSYNTPYISQTSQYSIFYAADQTASLTSINVPFYFVAQSSVTTVFVQQCPGLPCASCDITALSSRIIIAGAAVSGYSTLTQLNNGVTTTQLDFNNGQFGSSYGSAGGLATGSTPLEGKYWFPAIVGNNCVRFINQVNAGSAGTNQYTITIQLQVLNCGAYTSCQNCLSQGQYNNGNGLTQYCGWCNTNQFNVNSGSCHYGVSTNEISGGVTCLTSSSLTVPRWIFNPSQVSVNDPTACITVLRGDPRISGLQGQDFQVHGTPNEYFNLVSTPSLQVNSRFVYLDEAQCDNFTTCFSHPGTYIDEIGVMMGENKIRLVASAMGAAARVFVNGKEVSVSAHKHTAGKITATFANSRRVVVKTPEIMFTVSQSDKFFNVESALLKTELLDMGSKLVKLTSARAAEANAVMHGLIGQTWRNNVYAGDREYEGEVADYQVASGLWGKDFTFNLYQN